MYDEVSHWQWLAWGIGLLLFFYCLYYIMIKSAQYVRLRLYPPQVTVPILNEFGRTTTEEARSYSELESGEKPGESPA